jgi:hypothetical protein
MPSVPHVPDPLAALREVGKKFYKERRVEFIGHKIVLAPLGSAQEARANARVQDYRAVHFLKAVKVEQLAYAIVEVDGLRFQTPPAPDGGLDEAAQEEQARAKRAILDGWPDGAVTYLFQELCVLQDEVEGLVKAEVATLPPDEPDDAEPSGGEPAQPAA